MQTILESTTLPGALLNAYYHFGEFEAFFWKPGTARFDAAITNRKFLERVARFAHWARRTLTAKPVTAILLENRVEWNIADFGTMAAGGITVGLYKEESRADQQFKINNSRANLLVTNEPLYAAYAQELMSLCPTLEHILVCGPHFSVPPTRALGSETAVHDFASAVSGSESVEALAAMIGEVDEASICRHIYTSGTTGQAKAAQLSHSNFLSNFRGYYQRFDLAKFEGKPRYISYLPPSHVYEHGCALAVLLMGGQIWYSDKLQLKEDLKVVRPTVFPSVPKFYALVKSQLLAKRTMRWSLLSRWVPSSLKRLLAGRILRKVGLAETKLWLSAGARLADDVFVFYKDALGVEILSTYGASETTGAVLSPAPGTAMPGSVGCPLPGIVARIDDGELCLKGSSIFKGYLHLEEQNFDADGYFHTGDRVEMRGDQFFVQGRASQIVKMSNGKYVNLEAVADAILGKCPCVQQVAVFAEGMDEPVALISVGDEERILRLIAERVKIPFPDSVDAFIGSSELTKKLEDESRSYSQQSKSAGPGFHVKKFLYCPPFTVANEQQNAVQKLKYANIKRTYKAQIEATLDESGYVFQTLWKD